MLREQPQVYRRLPLGLFLRRLELCRREGLENREGPTSMLQRRRSVAWPGTHLFNGCSGPRLRHELFDRHAEMPRVRV
jgi:hypothetical protein